MESTYVSVNTTSLGVSSSTTDASNRNQQNVPQDTLAIFDLDSEHPYAPIMASKRVIGSEGLVPRGMKFDRKDRLLAVGNQNSSRWVGCPYFQLHSS
jgi:6-phosphogluconolactonase (cycloisomerase 2 family)